MYSLSERGKAFAMDAKIVVGGLSEKFEASAGGPPASGDRSRGRRGFMSVFLERPRGWSVKSAKSANYEL